MQNIELYINDILVDLDVNQKIALTKQINDFRELKDRQTHFTNSFNLPMTSNNNAVFDNLNLTGNQSRKPYERVNIKLRMNGIEVIHNGFGIIRKTDFKNNKYNISIYSGIINFFDALGNKTLENIINLSSLNHNLTNTEFIDSFSNDYADGYAYAIADFGNIKTSKIEINYQLPVIFVRWIWEQIFNEVGFTPNFYPEDDMVISMKRGWESVIETLESWSLDYKFETLLYDTCSDAGSVTDQCSILEVNNDDFANGFYFKEIPNDLDPNNVHVNNDKRIIITHNQKYQHHFDFEMNTLGYRLFSILVTKTDSNNQEVIVDEIFRTDAGMTETHIVTAGDYDYNYDIDLTKVWQLENGDTLKFEVKLEKINTGHSIDCYSEDQNGDIIGYYSCPDGFSIQSGTNNTFETLNDYVSQVDFRTLIGNIKYKDFIKDILNHYALMIDVDDEKNVRFIKANDMLVMNNADDWSDYFIEQIDESYMLKNYGQHNIIDYNYNKLAVTKFAEGTFTLNNETLPQEKTMFKRLWNASEKSSVELNGYLLQSLPFWEAQRDDNGNVTKWKPIKDKNYICRISTKNGTIQYGTTNGAIQTYTGDYYVLNFDNINGQFIIDEYYKKIKNMLNWHRIEHIQIRVDSFMFDKIDFFKLKYFKQRGAYYYLNKLKYDGKGTAIGEFIYVNL